MMLSAVKENCSLFLGDSPLHHDVKFAQGDISDAMQVPEVDFATRVCRILLYTELATYLYLCTFIKYPCALFPA